MRSGDQIETRIARAFSRWFVRIAAITAISFCTSPAFSQILVIATSDGHSHYGNLPSFLATAEAERLAFLARHPQGTVIVALAGDIFGSSVWTRENDRGWIAVRAVQALAAKATVVFVPGNHDGFDFASNASGNDVALAQFRELRRAGVHVLASNVRWASGLHEFGPGRLDVRTQDGLTLRISGFVISEFWRVSSAHRGSLAPVFDSVSPVVEGLQREYELASRDGVDALLPIVHEGFAMTARSLGVLYSSAGRSRAVPIPLAIAAHDHRTRNGAIHNPRSRSGAFDRDAALIDAGFGFNSWIAVLDERLRVMSLSLRAAGPLGPNAPIPAEAEEAHLFARRVRSTPGFRDEFPLGARAAAGADREGLSSAFALGMADVVARAGAGLAPTAALAIGFYGDPASDATPNELASLRTFGHLATAVGRRNPDVHVFMATRLGVVRLYRAFLSQQGRADMIAITSSSNIRESSIDGRVEVLNSDGAWAPLPAGPIAVAVDSRALSGVRRSELAFALGPAGPAAEMELVDAVLEHGPAAFAVHGVRVPPRVPTRPVSCPAFFASAANF